MQTGNTKLKILYLLKILLDETDEFHGITVKEVEDKLRQYGIETERKSIYRDVAVLVDYGIDIATERVDKSFYYKVISRDFELAELKLLVDAVQSSRFITEKKSKELIDKIVASASKYERSELNRHVFVNGKIKTENKTILVNVDHIHTAISDNRKINFKYFNWNVDKKMVLRHDGEIYSVSPWEMILDNENYYLVGFDDKDKKIKHYRVDKMLDVAVSKDTRAGETEFKKVNVSEYGSRVFGMFGGREESVHILCKNHMASIMIDQFGKDVMIIPKDSEKFELVTKVDISSQFISWILSFKGDVKVTSPQSVIDEIKEMGNIIANLYD